MWRRHCKHSSLRLNLSKLLSMAHIQLMLLQEVLLVRKLKLAHVALRLDTERGEYSS
jgi:hypothetical protein